MKKELISILLLLAASLALSSCMSATSAQGDKLTMVMTNTGFTTQNVTDSNSATKGIPLLGGGFDNEREQIPQDSSQETKITVGSITVAGVVDQGTPIDNSLGWVWRSIRTIVTGKVFITGLEEYFGEKTARKAGEAANDALKIKTDGATAIAKERADLIPKVNPELVPISPLKSP